MCFSFDKLKNWTFDMWEEMSAKPICIWMTRQQNAQIYCVRGFAPFVLIFARQSVPLPSQEVNKVWGRNAVENAGIQRRWKSWRILTVSRHKGITPVNVYRCLKQKKLHCLYLQTSTYTSHCFEWRAHARSKADWKLVTFVALGASPKKGCKESESLFERL